MGRTPVRALKASVSSESMELPEGQPAMDWRSPIIGSVFTCRGSNDAPKMTSFELRPSPPRVSEIALLLVAVATTTLAPPSFCNCSETLPAWLSM